MNLKSASFILQVGLTYPDCKLIDIQQGSRYRAVNFPINGFLIDFKPYNSGVLIFNFIEFYFFDLNLLSAYFKENLKHDKARFYVNSNCIYVNPHSNYSGEDLMELFKYTVHETLVAIERIRNSLRTVS